MNRYVTLTGMILVATASTLIPHPPNFTPLGAIALFAGAHFHDRRAAFATPLIVLLLRDIVIGLHVLMPAVYACIALTVWLGFWLRKDKALGRVALASVIASTLFFVITNFAVWAQLGTYPLTGSGLMACYAAALPYFKNTLASDLLYSAVMFGLMALADRRILKAKSFA